MNESDVAIRFGFALIIGVALAVFWALRDKK